MQKRKPGKPHKGWKAAARKARLRTPRKQLVIGDDGCFMLAKAKRR